MSLWNTCEYLWNTCEHTCEKLIFNRFTFDLPQFSIPECICMCVCKMTKLCLFWEQYSIDFLKNANTYYFYEKKFKNISDFEIHSFIVFSYLFREISDFCINILSRSHLTNQIIFNGFTYRISVRYFCLIRYIFHVSDNVKRIDSHNFLHPVYKSSLTLVQEKIKKKECFIKNYT